MLITVQFVTQWILLLVIPLALVSVRSRTVHYAGLASLVAMRRERQGGLLGAIVNVSLANEADSN